MPRKQGPWDETSLMRFYCNVGMTRSCSLNFERPTCTAGAGNNMCMEMENQCLLRGESSRAAATLIKQAIRKGNLPERAITPIPMFSFYAFRIGYRIPLDAPFGRTRYFYEHSERPLALENESKTSGVTTALAKSKRVSLSIPN